MKVLSVVGARPQFVKLAPVAEALAGRCEHVIVHTGQHYDARLSDVFFADLKIPAPDVHLGIGSASHGHQTGAMLAGIEDVLLAQRPDWVLVYGDTNSTLAATVAAVKLHQKVAHLEAGLRSFNRRMPEEHNRVLTDHAADLCLAPTEVAMGHLRDEGLAARSTMVGDVMTDVCLRVAQAVQDEPPTTAGVDPEQGYYLATIHRAENTDDPQRLHRVVESLAALDHPVLLLAHPRLVATAERQGLPLAQGSVVVAEPQPYPELIRLALHSRGVVTDSGGLQKEAFLLRVPCTTLRTETEWTETVDLGWNVLDGDLVDVAAAAARPEPPATDAAPYGDGHAAQRVAAVLLGETGSTSES
ncbi:non-hydrolyzing UDP-N-acetylglucosamine 2-epimerase [Angustibacter luteus]|uniref:Non-hydrolyzing UDP-N-acetylglucosamine 2-epimerase n=1 Tax=Angustibacter luteus TaxID=658456 RepID=A0ABW1JH44_9ACTN